MRAEIMDGCVEPAPWLDAPWRAWHALSSERQHVMEGFGAPMGAIRIVSRPQAIPWSAMQTWCDRARCDDDEREFIVSLVVAMDRAFLQWRGERIAAELKAMVR